MSDSGKRKLSLFHISCDMSFDWNSIVFKEFQVENSIFHLKKKESEEGGENDVTICFSKLGILKVDWIL